MAKKRIYSFYIVDDDKDLVEFLTSLLEAAGHKVASNTSSPEALKDIVESKPDCVIADMMMPELDGTDLCQRLRENPALEKTKIVVVSAKAYEFDRKQAFKFGADGYMVKPVNVETFVTRVVRTIEDRMEMTFWGVHGTLPVPGPGTLRYGGNTSCVSLEFSKDRLFVFDAGSGIKVLSDRLMAQRRRNIEAKIFISHPHWDHINAIPFFTPLYIQGNEFEICGARHGDITTRELISAQMDGVYFPITVKEFGARVYFKDLEEEELDIDGIKVTTMLLNHPGKCLGYRVDYKGKSFCYITDNEFYLEDNEFYNPFYVKNLAKFVEGTDALITDCTYTDDEYRTKVGWGHSCISKVVEFADLAEAKTLYLFHHDPEHSDDDIDAKVKTARKLLKQHKSKTKVVAPAEGQMFNI